MHKKSKKTGIALGEVCHCGNSKSLVECCGRYVYSENIAPDAQSLMRSRYTAYVLDNEAYLLATWHTSTRPVRIDAEPTLKWLGLTVLSFAESGETAQVSFVARYKLNGRVGRMAETSYFVRESGYWFYVDGVVSSS